MMGAVQPFLSGAISKTVNMPQESTVDDIAEAYINAWRLGVKALAIYRDGSKTAQALRTDAQETKALPAKAEAAIEAGEEIFTQSEVDDLITVARQLWNWRVPDDPRGSAPAPKDRAGDHAGWTEPTSTRTSTSPNR